MYKTKINIPKHPLILEMGVRLEEDTVAMMQVYNNRVFLSEVLWVLSAARCSTDSNSKPSSA